MDAYDRHRAAAIAEGPGRFARIFHETRTDWPLNELTEFIREQGRHIRLEIIGLAMAISFDRRNEDGSWVLNQPSDVLSGPWLSVAQTMADQLDAEARDRAARQ